MVREVSDSVDEVDTSELSDSAVELEEAGVSATVSTCLTIHMNKFQRSVQL